MNSSLILNSMLTEYGKNIRIRDIEPEVITDDYITVEPDKTSIYEIIENGMGQPIQLDDPSLLHHLIRFKKFEQYRVTCLNCRQIFMTTVFLSHVCDHDENGHFIEPDQDSMSVSSGSKLVDMLRENNDRIRKFKRNELRIVSHAVAPKPGKDGPHQCMTCDRKFVHASGLARHMEKHDLDKNQSKIKMNRNMESFETLKVVAKCFICGQVFSRATDAVDHLQKHGQFIQSIEEYDTEDDQEKLELSKQAADQTHSVHDELKVIVINSILQCEFCDYKFTHINTLLEHEAVHDPSKGFECTECNMNVMQLKDILVHRQIECVHAKLEPGKLINLQTFFVCNVCDNKFQSLEALYDHRYESIHLFPRYSHTNNVLNIVCEKCGLSFSAARSLIVHNAERHMKRMKKEIGIGSGKYRQYLCDVCGKSYTQSSHLWQHLRFHRGVKPFACKEEGCSRRFTIRPDLNDHIRKCHTGERPYHCLICGKRFLTGSVFYQHRLIHRGERRYGCEECGKRFYRADALKNHQRIHTGEKPYACTMCTKNFRQRGDRDKHIRTRHCNVTILRDDDVAGNTFIGHKPFGFDTTEGKVPKMVGQRRKYNKKKQNDNIVFVGDVPFPKSMFVPIISDIDNSCSQ